MSITTLVTIVRHVYTRTCVCLIPPFPQSRSRHHAGRVKDTHRDVGALWEEGDVLMSIITLVTIVRHVYTHTCVCLIPPFPQSRSRHHAGRVKDTHRDVGALWEEGDVLMSIITLVTIVRHVYTRTCVCLTPPFMRQ